MRHESKRDPEIGDGEGLGAVADKAMSDMPSPSPTVIDDIRIAHRERCFHMEQRKRADLAIGSFLRTAFGWSKEGDTEVNEAAKEKAAALMEIGEAESVVVDLLAKCGGDESQLKGHDKPALKRAREKVAVEEPAYFQWRRTILAAIAGRKAFDQVEADATERMRTLAETLPVYSWWKDNVFKDALQLAVIVGEAGDLSNYPEATYPELLPSGLPHPKAGQPRKVSSGPSCLWKRMGVAVIGAGDGEDDRRQGGLSKSASKEEWMDHGYSRKRRSRLFVIGDVITKQSGHPYREIYLTRKEYERKKAEAKGLIVAPSASIPKKRAHEFMSLGHIDKRARRYMEKRLLRDLWKAWRRAAVEVAEKPTAQLPAAGNARKRARDSVAAKPTDRVPASSPTASRWLDHG